MRTILKLSLVFASSVAVGAVMGLTGCSSGRVGSQSLTAESTLTSSGSLVIARVVPEVIQSDSSAIYEMPLPDSARGFVSLPNTVSSTGTLPSTGSKVVIDRSLKTAVVSSSLGIATFSDIEITGSLVAGECKITLKQVDPSWFADDTYYSSRGLSIPSISDPTRFLRGAYGDAALFCDSSTVIHSSPFGTGDVGGIKLNSFDITSAFELLNVGDSIVIR